MEFDAVIKRYRAKAADPSAADGLTMEQAIEALGVLGIASGDAMWWLNRKARI